MAATVKTDLINVEGVQKHTMKLSNVQMAFSMCGII